VVGIAARLGAVVIAVALEPQSQIRPNRNFVQCSYLTVGATVVDGVWGEARGARAATLLAHADDLDFYQMEIWQGSRLRVREV
jgi:hypothetical protein